MTLLRSAERALASDLTQAEVVYADPALNKDQKKVTVTVDGGTLIVKSTELEALTASAGDSGAFFDVKTKGGNLLAKGDLSYGVNMLKGTHKGIKLANSGSLSVEGALTVNNVEAAGI